MTSIPLTFSEHQISRAIIGGYNNHEEKELNISVILLNKKGAQFKLPLYENLIQCNFRSIISVEAAGGDFSIEEVSKKYPSIKFIIPQEKTNDGDLINIAMSEVDSEYVLVLRDTVNIPSGFILPNLAESLTKKNIFCIVPRLFDVSKTAVPCSFSPKIDKNHFEVDSSRVMMDGLKTLYPFDYIALYNREKFIQLGGYDWTINSPYWQILDLGLRSWLWGEETRITALLQFNYIENPPLQDKTSNIDYLRYYLKNEMPILKNGKGFIKKSNFFTFKLQSSCGFFEAKRQFNDARNWVEKNKYRFTMDLETFINKWSIDEK